MDRQPNALTTAASDLPGWWSSLLVARLAVIGTLVLAVLLLWLMAVVTPLVAFVIAVALAIAWCLWLERDAEHRADNDTPPSEIDRQ